MMNEPKAQKNSAEFWLFGQASSRRRRATKYTLQSGSLRSPSFFASFGALLRLYSAWCTCSASLCMCLLYVPLDPPPPAPSERTKRMRIGDYWRGHEKGRVGGSVEKPS